MRLLRVYLTHVFECTNTEISNVIDLNLLLDEYIYTYIYIKLNNNFITRGQKLRTFRVYDNSCVFSHN